ncbi:hypothetical protein B0H14DRAFT_2944140, partial [Mycena olivaceomarginata]
MYHPPPSGLYSAYAALPLHLPWRARWTTRPRPHFTSYPSSPSRAPNLSCLSDRSQRSDTTSVSGARYDERARGDGAEQISHPVTTSFRRCERRDTAHGARMTQIAHDTRSSCVARAGHECTRWRGRGAVNRACDAHGRVPTGRQGAHTSPPRHVHRPVPVPRLP